MYLQAKVVPGSGRASQITNLAYRTRCEAAGKQLVRGTLNAHVQDLQGVIRSLPEPHFNCDGNNDLLGPIRWWQIMVHNKRLGISQEAFITRHENSRAQFLEIMSDTHFRDDLGIVDGDSITVEIVEPEHVELHWILNHFYTKN